MVRNPIQVLCFEHKGRQVRLINKRQETGGRRCECTMENGGNQVLRRGSTCDYKEFMLYVSLFPSVPSPFSFDLVFNTSSRTQNGCSAPPRKYE